MRLLIYLYTITLFVPGEVEVGGIILTPSRVVFVPLAILVVLKLLITEHGGSLFTGTRPWRFVTPLLVLSVYSLGLLLMRPHRDRMIIDALELCQVVMSFIILFGSRSLPGLTSRDGERLLSLIFALSLVGAARIIYGYLTASQYAEFRPYRLDVVGRPLFAVFYSCVLYRSTKQVRYSLALIVSLVAITLLQTGGVWITGIFVFTVVGMRYRTRLLSIRTLVLVVYLVLLIVPLLTLLDVTLIPRDVDARWRSIFEGTRDFTDRFVNWRISIDIFKSYPLGTGLGTWRFYAPVFDLYPSYFASHLGEGVLGPHSDWFLLLAEAGIIGVLSIGWLWFQIGRTVLLHRAETDRGLIVWCAVLATFIDSFNADQLLGGGGVTLALFLSLYFMFEQVGKKASVAKTTPLVGGHCYVCQEV